MFSALFALGAFQGDDMDDSLGCKNRLIRLTKLTISGAIYGGILGGSLGGIIMILSGNLSIGVLASIVIACIAGGALIGFFMGLNIIGSDQSL
jgi:hypothetical protein